MNPAIARRAKAYAREHQLTFTAVMERALVEYLARSPKPAPGRQPLFPTFSTGGLRPGVSLDDNAQLLDIMDGFREPD